MKRWHLWLALVLAALALLLGVVVRHRRPPVRVLLPTGEMVSVAGVTYGTNHVAPERYPLERRLPTPLRRAAERLLQLPPLPPDATTSEPVLRVWLRLAPGPTTNAMTTPMWCYAALQTADGVVGGMEQQISLLGPLTRRDDSSIHR